MKHYTYIAEIGGRKVTLTINSPSFSELRYKVQIKDKTFGHIYTRTDVEHGKVWDGDTPDLKALAEEIGDFIDRTNVK